MEFNMDFFKLNDKVAMITGGNTGIGMALAKALATAGANIFVYSYGDENVEELEDFVTSRGGKFAFAKGNLMLEADANGAVGKCIEAMGKIDILVNNAGSIYRAPILEGENNKWDDIINLNLNSVYYLSKEAAREMVKQGSGKIINIASMLSFQGGKFVPSYTASKHGVAGLTKAFANELAEKNIQINAIAPGYIATANTAPIRADEKRNTEILGRIPANRWGETSDLQGTVVFLASKASDYINGHIVAVDGGWLTR